VGYFRFQRRIGIGPGLRLNISKRSVSLSEGVRGAHVTIGKTPRVTLGIPGSGLSWTQTFATRRRGRRGGVSLVTWAFALFALYVVWHALTN
jgi:Protein of unknown function (DUF4236)